MKVVSKVQVLCVGGEISATDLEHLLGIKNLQISVSSYDEALAALARAPFDLVVMDDADRALDQSREQIIASLPASAALVIVPRSAARKLPAPAVAAKTKLQTA